MHYLVLGPANPANQHNRLASQVNNSSNNGDGDHSLKHKARVKASNDADHPSNKRPVARAASHNLRKNQLRTLQQRHPPPALHLKPAVAVVAVDRVTGVDVVVAVVVVRVAHVNRNPVVNAQIPNEMKGILTLHNQGKTTHPHVTYKPKGSLRRRLPLLPHRRAMQARKVTGPGNILRPAQNLRDRRQLLPLQQPTLAHVNQLTVPPVLTRTARHKESGPISDNRNI